MSTIAVLGMGLLGRGFAENLLSKGQAVRVWNRTASKAAPLGELGAHVAETPAEAVRGAERVHLILSADAAVDSVIEALRAGLGDGAPIVDHSTNLPEAVSERFARLRGEGVRYIHAPVFMGPQHSKNAEGLMLISGPQDDVAALTPSLSTMTGKVLNLGPEPDRAATIKIIGNSMLFTLTAGMADAFAIGRARGLSEEDVLGLFEIFAPSALGMGTRIVNAGQGPVGFELSMARKDARLMVDTAGAENLSILPAIAAAMDRGIAEGRGAEDFAGMFRGN